MKPFAVKLVRVIVCCFLCLGLPALGTAAEEPQVAEIRFSPESPVTGDTLNLIVKLEGSALRAEVAWKVDGVEVERGDHNGFAPSVEFKRKLSSGQKITAEVKAFDANSAAGPIMTKSVVVGAAPPTAELKDQKITPTMYTAQLDAKDPEGGPVKLAIKQGPDGMTIDKGGAIKWPVNESISGTFPVAVSITTEKGTESILQFNVGLRWQPGR